jgi:hypothetical protein
VKTRQRLERPIVQVVAGLAVVALIPTAALVAQGLEEPTAPAASSAYAEPAPVADPTPGGAEDIGPTVDACRTASMAVSLGPAEGAAGTVYRPLRFTNTSARPCFVHGFPGVSYVAGDLYTQIGPAAEEEGEKGMPLTLPPRAVASAKLGLVKVGTFDPSLCHGVPVRGLRVYLPGDIASEFVALPGRACSGKINGAPLRVRSIVPGPGQG